MSLMMKTMKMNCLPTTLIMMNILRLLLVWHLFTGMLNYKVYGQRTDIQHGDTWQQKSAHGSSIKDVCSDGEGGRVGSDADKGEGDLIACGRRLKITKFLRSSFMDSPSPTSQLAEWSTCRQWSQLTNKLTHWLCNSLSVIISMTGHLDNSQINSRNCQLWKLMH